MNRVWTTIFAISVAAVLSAAPAGPAAAHHVLSTSTPAAGAQLHAPPARISLTFAFDVRTDGAAVSLVDDGGASRTTGALEVRGATVSIAVDPSIGDGHHEVRWRVRSFDGAPLQGEIPFVIGDVGPDPDPLRAVISADGASVIRVVALAVLTGLLVCVARALATTYGRSARTREDRCASAPDAHG